MRYRENTPVVLNNISLTINPREKIGIAGRTGSGKSTILQILFRIIELEEGQILIDNLDIGTIDLKLLRSNICIIPQDPVLFIGTLRYNLDPFNMFEDERLEKVLDEVQLKEKFKNEEQILNKDIEEQGQNISVGERQLICIARAILKPSKILVMDEATASLDFKTDLIISNLIRQKFEERTVLIIAHRVNTIQDCDKILELDKGTVKRFDESSNVIKAGSFRVD